MAGFRNERGPDQGIPPTARHPQQHGGYSQQYGQPTPSGEPEYFGEPAAPSYANDNPGSTQAFSIHDAPDAYGPGPGRPDQGYDEGGTSTYRAGGTSTDLPAGPRLPWKQLLTGMVMRPGRTFLQMRDYQVWVPALTVTFIYGLLALFGSGEAREELLTTNTGTGIMAVTSVAIALIVCGLMLGLVTNSLARQFGGVGSWAPTIGMAMLITSLTDMPRLLFAIFLGGDNIVVQVIGWLTWAACAALLTSMVSKSHELPWPRALGAASVQLIALLLLIKLALI